MRRWLFKEASNAAASRKLSRHGLTIAFLKPVDEDGQGAVMREPASQVK
jgi:hypothetical protein